MKMSPMWMLVMTVGWERTRFSHPAGDFCLQLLIGRVKGPTTSQQASKMPITKPIDTKTGRITVMLLKSEDEPIEEMT